MKRPLTRESRENLRLAWDEAFRGGGAGKITVLEDGVKVYQLVDGVWHPLDPSDPEGPSDVPPGHALFVGACTGPTKD